MSEPGWNLTSESGTDVPEDLNPAQAQIPDPANRPSVPSAGPLAGHSASSRRRRPTMTMLMTTSRPRTTPPRTTAWPRMTTPPAPAENWRRGFSPGLARLARGAGSAARQGVQLALRYPRASLASGLSVGILSAVMLLQPGKGKNDTTAAISSAAAAAQTASTDHETSGGTGSGAGKHETAGPAPSPASGQAGADADPPVVFAGKDAKAASTAPASVPARPFACSGFHGQVRSRREPRARACRLGGLLRGVGSWRPPIPKRTGPAPAPALTETASLPAAEPVKLTGGESLVPLPQVGDGPAPVIGTEGEKLPDPAPAPAPPILELAAADTKPVNPQGPAAAAPAPSRPGSFFDRACRSSPRRHRGGGCRLDFGPRSRACPRSGN